MISSCFKAQSMAESFLFSSIVAALGSADVAGVLAAGALLGCDGVAAGWAVTGGVESGGLLVLDLQPVISKAAVTPLLIQHSAFVIQHLVLMIMPRINLIPTPRLEARRRRVHA